MDELNPLTAEDETKEDESPLEEYREWLDKIEAREKEFESGWWKQAHSAVVMYDGESKTANDESTAYNILYSNTEVLIPSLYSATPKPDVRSRYKDQELKPIPEVLERYLTVLSDPESPGHESLDDAMSETVLSSLTAGMGFVRLRHYPNRPIPISLEAGHYKGLIWGKARKWSKVPWIAFRHELTKGEFFEQFGIEGPGQDDYIPPQESESDSDSGSKAKVNGTVVYELWNKAERKICFLSPDWKPLLIREDVDTLKLDGFFPTPGLLLLTSKPGKIVPIPLYQFYKNQAEELNRVTIRLNKVLSAIRVRGAYNGLLGGDMEKILNDQEMENGLVPASEAAMLAAQGGGFERHIWLLPVEKLIQVATQLYQARQQIKQVIYELTGISDIIRGASVASETATAQDLKNKWGTIRLRKMQSLVASYVRDLYRLSVDAGSSVVEPRQWKEITQLPIPTQEEKQTAIQQLRVIQERQQMMATMAQQMGAQPQPPQPPNPQLVQAAQSPSWEEILQKISSDQNRTFLINVQTSSTIDLDTASDKEEVGEFMTAMGQLMAGLQPLVQLGPSGLEAAKQILLAVCQRYKFGLSIIDAIKALQMPPPAQQGEAEKAKAQAEIEVIKAETESKKLIASLAVQKAQMDMELAREKLVVEKEKLQIDLAKARLSIQAAQAKVTVAAQGQREMNAAKAEGKPKNAPVSS